MDAPVSKKIEKKLLHTPEKKFILKINLQDEKPLVVNCFLIGSQFTTNTFIVPSEQGVKMDTSVAEKVLISG